MPGLCSLQRSIRIVSVDLLLLCFLKGSIDIIVYECVHDSSLYFYVIFSLSFRSAESWPQRILMQLMPKSLINNIGGAYLKNSKSVNFHPQPCEALETLKQVLLHGYVSHFQNPSYWLFMKFRFICNF